jgi:hypothetical protein
MKNVQPKSILKNIKSEFDGLLEEKDNTFILIAWL